MVTILALDDDEAAAIAVSIAAGAPPSLREILVEEMRDTAARLAKLRFATVEDEAAKAHLVASLAKVAGAIEALPALEAA